MYGLDDGKRERSRERDPLNFATQLGKKQPQMRKMFEEWEHDNVIDFQEWSRECQ